MKPVGRAALDGAIATVPQTLVQAAGVLGGEARWIPPQEIAGVVVERAGVRAARPDRPAFHAVWLAAHVGYGAVLGVAYRCVRSRVHAGPIAAGVAFGLAVWGLHYLALLPRLGLYPAPRADPAGRRRANVAAHCVFGLALGLLERRRRYY